LDKARKQGDELRSQLAQANEQLKASQDRVVQLGAQLKQAPALTDLDKARKQGDELRPQLSQVSEQPKDITDQPKPSPTAANPLSFAERTTAPVQLAEDVSTPVRQPNNTASTGHVDPVPPQDPTPRSLSSADIPGLLARGDSLLGMGDVASGRLFYERAAAAGDGKAALRLGETYDPAFLKRMQLRIQGDNAKAVYWYRRAFELGQNEAEILLKDAQSK
jgi:TPR repeat protein